MATATNTTSECAIEHCIITTINMYYPGTQSESKQLHNKLIIQCVHVGSDLLKVGIRLILLRHLSDLTILHLLAYMVGYVLNISSHQTTYSGPMANLMTCSNMPNTCHLFYTKMAIVPRAVVYHTQIDVKQSSIYSFIAKLAFCKLFNTTA